MSSLVWLEVVRLISETTVVQKQSNQSYERGMQDSLALLMQIYNLDQQREQSANRSLDTYSIGVIDTSLDYLLESMLSPFFEVFSSKVLPNLVRMYNHYSSKEQNSFTGIVAFTAVFSVVYFCMIVVVDVDFTKRLDRIVRLFYGFKTQDCREIIMRCERLMDKIQASQFNKDYELLTITEGDSHDPRQASENGQSESTTRKRKGKGSLVKLLSLTMALVLLFVVGNFFLKFYMVLSHRSTQDKLAKIFKVGLDLDRFQVLLSSSSAYLVRSCVDPEAYLTKSQTLVDDSQTIWSTLQQVTSHSAFLTLRTW
jgi:hypothetical protein